MNRQVGQDYDSTQHGVSTPRREGNLCGQFGGEEKRCGTQTLELLWREVGGAQVLVGDRKLGLICGMTKTARKRVLSPIPNSWAISASQSKSLVLYYV